MAYRLKAVLSVLLMTFLLAGCSNRIGDFTIVSTKNVGFGQEYNQMGSTKGSDSVFLFGSPDMKTAVDNALENAGGSARYLTNARIMQTTILGYNKITVEGDAWAPSSMSDAGGDTHRLERSEEGLFLVSEDGSERLEVLEPSEVDSEDIEVRQVRSVPKTAR